MGTEPCDLSAIAARALIGVKKLSPMELLASCIDRIESVDHAVNAVVARDFARAREAALAAERRVMRGDSLPPLHGLPLGIKDLDNTAGLRTTYGSLRFADHVPVADDPVIARVRAAGGIVLGKTNTPEFGAGANTRNAVYGATGNPFDPTLSAAGSSGGSAVALATGMVPLATGSDMGGSLRNPASFCGIVGFRPSPGAVPRRTTGNAFSPLSVLGPMARTVADCALLFSAMRGHDLHDPFSRPDIEPIPHVDLSALRLAVSTDLDFAAVEHGVAETFRARLATIAAPFATVDQATPDCTGTDEAFAVLRAVSFLGAHADPVAATPDLVGENIRANVAEGLAYTAQDVARAYAAQTRIAANWLAFFQTHDVLITPAISIAPRPWTEWAPQQIDGRPMQTYFQWLALAYAVSLVGLPAICLPCGLGPTGMPFGIQIISTRGSDNFLLSAAAALETVLAENELTARPQPDLAALRASPPISGDGRSSPPPPPGPATG